MTADQVSTLLLIVALLCFAGVLLDALARDMERATRPFDPEDGEALNPSE